MLGKKSPLGKNLFLAHEPVRSQICLKLAVPVACYTHVLINKRNLLSAEYEKSFTTALHAVTPRHPIAMTSTAKPPDPMPCALAAVLLPESRAHGCHMQKTLFPVISLNRFLGPVDDSVTTNSTVTKSQSFRGQPRMYAGEYMLGPCLGAGCAHAAWAGLVPGGGVWHHG